MAETDDLNLPNIGPGVLLPPTPRSLDEIDAWIQEDFELFFDRESYDREKARMTVPQQFRLD